MESNASVAGVEAGRISGRCRQGYATATVKITDLGAVLAQNQRIGELATSQRAASGLRERILCVHLTGAVDVPQRRSTHNWGVVGGGLRLKLTVIDDKLAVIRTIVHI